MSKAFEKCPLCGTPANHIGGSVPSNIYSDNIHMDRDDVLDELCRMFNNAREYFEQRLKKGSGGWVLENAVLDPTPDTLAAIRMGYAMAKAEN